MVMEKIRRKSMLNDNVYAHFTRKHPILHVSSILLQIAIIQQV